MAALCVSVFDKRETLNSLPGLCQLFLWPFLIVMLLISSKRSSGQTINLGTVSLENMAFLPSLSSLPCLLTPQEIKPWLLSASLRSCRSQWKITFFVSLFNHTGHRAIRQEIMSPRQAVRGLQQASRTPVAVRKLRVSGVPHHCHLFSHRP